MRTILHEKRHQICVMLVSHKDPSLYARDLIIFISIFLSYARSFMRRGRGIKIKKLRSSVDMLR